MYEAAARQDKLCPSNMMFCALARLSLTKMRTDCKLAMLNKYQMLQQDAKGKQLRTSTRPLLTTKNYCGMPDNT